MLEPGLQTHLPVALAVLAEVQPLRLALIIGLLILSLSIHEVAHAWVALRCGDTTARDLGRITLNPLPHIDPIMTVLMPIILYMAIGIPFGGAKPVPVNPYRLRHPSRDMALVALAGPLSNVVLAFVFFAIRKPLLEFGGYESIHLLPYVLEVTVVLNLVLAVFNMIPVPPLDGSRIMAWLLPNGIRETYVGFERYGLLIVFGLFYFRVFDTILRSTIDPMYRLVGYVISLGGLW